MEFNSEEGAGTTVTIYLPRVDKRMRLLPGPGDGKKEEGEVIELEAIDEKVVEKKKGGQ